MTAYEENNEYGFLVLVTPNGSMTKKAFLHFAKPFVKYINMDREEGEPAILLMDGHSSRWNEEAIDYLLQNKVYPFFHPSHTSVWSQANANGPNKGIHGHLSDAVNSSR